MSVSHSFHKNICCKYWLYCHGTNTCVYFSWKIYRIVSLLALLLVGLSPTVLVLPLTRLTLSAEEWWWHLVRPSSTRVLLMHSLKSWRTKDPNLSSRELVRTSFVPLPALVSLPVMTSSRSLFLERSMVLAELKQLWEVVFRTPIITHFSIDVDENVSLFRIFVGKFFYSITTNLSSRGIET